MPVLVPGWSLNFEMAFYIVFALSLWVPSRLRLGFVGAIFLLLFVLVQLPWGNTLPKEFWFYVDPRIVEFWLGMLVGSQVVASWNQLRAPVCLVVGYVRGRRPFACAVSSLRRFSPIRRGLDRQCPARGRADLGSRGF